MAAVLRAGPEGKTLAIPLQGSWDASRTHVANDEITFACTNGALAKCVRWGYKPWKTVNGVSLADYHQACVHMTGADYCGDGKSHTRDGTPIDLWDNLGVQKRDPSLGLAFEAAWSTRGAVYLQKPRYGETLQSLVAACPGHLRGHTALDAPNLDQAAIMARWPEALIFTESRVAVRPALRSEPFAGGSGPRSSAEPSSIVRALWRALRSRAARILLVTAALIARWGARPAGRAAAGHCLA